MAAASPARIGEPPMCRSDRSPFDTLEATFRLLAAGPQPLALHGRTIGLAVESIRLWDLRAILFHPATGVAVQRAALVALVGRARRRRGAWVVGLADVLLGQPRTPRRGPAWRLFPEGPGEPVSHGGGGRRVAARLGELGLQAQGSAGRCSAWRPALALSRAGAHDAAVQASRGVHAAGRRRWPRPAGATNPIPSEVASQLNPTYATTTGNPASWAACHRSTPTSSQPFAVCGRPSDSLRSWRSSMTSPPATRRRRRAACSTRSAARISPRLSPDPPRGGRRPASPPRGRSPSTPDAQPPAR